MPEHFCKRWPENLENDNLKKNSQQDSGKSMTTSLQKFHSDYGRKKNVDLNILVNVDLKTLKMTIWKKNSRQDSEKSMATSLKKFLSNYGRKKNVDVNILQTLTWTFCKRWPEILQTLTWKSWKWHFEKKKSDKILKSRWQHSWKVSLRLWSEEERWPERWLEHFVNVDLKTLKMTIWKKNLDRFLKSRWQLSRKKFSQVMVGRRTLTWPAHFGNVDLHILQTLTCTFCKRWPQNLENDNLKKKVGQDSEKSVTTFLKKFVRLWSGENNVDLNIL